MPNKPAYTISQQIELLKQRGMLFRNEESAQSVLKNISYYRLKGYWWDLQTDCKQHSIIAGTYFEDVVEIYKFDRQLRIILFDAIEMIEIALRTKMIYHLSLAHGGLWYLNSSLFDNKETHSKNLHELKSEFDRSQEIFVKDHKRRYPDKDADAWKTLEVASMGMLSKLYKNIHHQSSEKSIIAKEMGLNLHNELSSWLESIAYLRNMIAHHSRLWNRNMVKKPIFNLKNPSGLWFSEVPVEDQTKKPFLIISCMLYLCDQIEPEHQIRSEILGLIGNHPSIPVYKLGFFNNWNTQPIWNN
ncbi:MAG TPA: Abi family protein [bacterium]|nr:Abi family protein [bacterium]